MSPREQFVSDVCLRVTPYRFVRLALCVLARERLVDVIALFSLFPHVLALYSRFRTGVACCAVAVLVCLHGVCLQKTTGQKKTPQA